MLSSNDIEKIKNRTKLTLADTHKLTELSVIIFFSLHGNRIRPLENVILFGIPKKSPNTSNHRAEDIIFHIILKTYGRYEDYVHARFQSKKQS